MEYLPLKPVIWTSGLWNMKTHIHWENKKPPESVGQSYWEIGFLCLYLLVPLNGTERLVILHGIMAWCRTELNPWNSLTNHCPGFVLPSYVKTPSVTSQSRPWSAQGRKEEVQAILGGEQGRELRLGVQLSAPKHLPSGLCLAQIRELTTAWGPMTAAVSLDGCQSK